MKKTVKKRNRKLKLKSLIIVFVILLIFGVCIYSFFNIKLTNIYITGNQYFKDQEIIEYLGIEDYPSMISVRSSSLKKTLKKNILIRDSKISRVGLSGIRIKIKENYPLFYDKGKDKTILYDGRTTTFIPAPTLINYVPDKKYKRLIKKLREVDTKILSKISEIEYDPNEVDEELFLLRMNDGNYVYITLLKIKSLNEYVTIIKNFKGKRGILYLDSGEYFKVLGEN